MQSGMNLIRAFSRYAYAGTLGLVFGPPYYLSLFEASLSLAVKLRSNPPSSCPVRRWIF